jgi:hypothetical protein
MKLNDLFWHQFPELKIKLYTHLPSAIVWMNPHYIFRIPRLVTPTIASGMSKSVYLELPSWLYMLKPQPKTFYEFLSKANPCLLPMLKDSIFCKTKTGE